MSDAIAVVNKQAAIERLRTSLEDIVTIRDRWIDGKRQELERAIEAHKALVGAGASETKQRYSRNRVQLLRKIVNCLEAGFVPIPRFTANKVNVDLEELPLNALMALNDAKATGLFDEVKLVSGDRPDVGSKARGRDPLLVGIVKMPAAFVATYNYLGYRTGWRRYPARQQHFLIAWWRPEDEVDNDLW